MPPIYLPCDNDVQSEDFESKMDPMFLSSYQSPYERQKRRRIEFNEARSGFVPANNTWAMTHP